MNRKERARRSRYAVAAAGTALFGAVYECFSHQVYSKAMIFAFLIPLLGGLIPCSLLSLIPCRDRPSERSRSLWDAGLAALTVGSVFRGILEIYGTTSRLSAVYTGAGAILAGLSVGCWAFETLRHRKRNTPSP